MKAAQITAPEQIRVIETEPPQPGPGEVLIQVKAAGICGTDLHIYHGEYMATYPLIPGHEFSGVVAAVGDGVVNFNVGDRVTADPNIPCGRCEFCQRNQPNQCRDLQAIGVTRSGAFAEYVVVPESVTFALGDLSFEAGALVEPLACVAWGLERLSMSPGSTAVVFGAGPMGCLLFQAIKACGIGHVTVVDRAPRRLEMAAQLGADRVAEAGEALDEYDLVVDATGIPDVIGSCVDYARPRGTIWVFGVAPTGAKASFEPYTVFRKDLTIFGSFAVNRTFPQSLALIRSGAVQVTPLISHRLPLDAFADGLHLAEHDPDRMKVQFTMD